MGIQRRSQTDERPDSNAKRPPVTFLTLALVKNYTTGRLVTGTSIGKVPAMSILTEASRRWHGCDLVPAKDLRVPGRVDRPRKKGSVALRDNR
jgi:hypothetical protein